MRRAFTLLPLLTLGARAAPANYYPHAAGQSWTYASGETQVVGQPVTYRGVQITPVNHQLGRTLIRQDLMEYRADGSVWMRGYHQGGKLTWLTRPLNVYPPAPLQVGQNWKSGPDTNQVTGVKAVQTGAGTFNAFEIATRQGGTGRPQYSYFVPTIGIVQYQTAEGTVIPLQSRK